jgi:hypothetical protein
MSRWALYACAGLYVLAAFTAKSPGMSVVFMSYAIANVALAHV